MRSCVAAEYALLCVVCAVWLSGVGGDTALKKDALYCSSMPSKPEKSLRIPGLLIIIGLSSVLLLLFILSIVTLIKLRENNRYLHEVKKKYKVKKIKRKREQVEEEQHSEHEEAEAEQSGVETGYDTATGDRTGYTTGTQGYSTAYSSYGTDYTKGGYTTGTAGGHTTATRTRYDVNSAAGSTYQ